MTLKARHYLVTGGAGFVGSHLADRLIAQGHRVTILDDLSSGSRANLHTEATFIKADVRDASLVADLIDKTDGCFHLAAIASVQECNRSWRDSHSVNLSAFVTLLESVAKRAGGPIPVVYASSAAVYGNTQKLPVDEKLPPRPISVYGADKAACELHAYAAGRTARVPTFGLRPFNIYGPRQNPASPYSGVISIFADRLKKNQPLTIYGDGAQTRDFIHVEDVIAMLIAALDKASVDAPLCNAATGKETSVLDVAHKLAAILKVEPQIAFAAARDGDIHRSVADITRLERTLGPRPPIDIDQGLKFILNE